MFPAKTPPASRIPALAVTCLALLVLATALFRATLSLGDPDIWFHLRYAEYFLQHHTLVPDHGLYSWTPAESAMAYCAWLPELLFYGLHALGGVRAMLLPRYLPVLVFFALAAWRIRHLAPGIRPAAWLAVMLGLLMAQAGLYCKPELFSLLGMILLSALYWHVRADPVRRLRRLYLAPLLFLLWANSHGGVIFGYVLLATLLGAEALDRITGRGTMPRPLGLHLLWSALLAVLALCLTPYGLTYPAQLARLVLGRDAENLFPSGEHIGAYQGGLADTPVILDFHLVGGLALAWGLVLLLARPRRAPDTALVVANLVMGALACLYYRTTFYWAPVYVFSMLHLLGQAPGRAAPPSRSPRGGLLSGRAAALGAWLCCLALAGAAWRDMRCHPPGYQYLGLDRGEASPYACADYIARHYPGQDIANTYEAGSYLLWRLRDTGNRVMIDSRHFPYTGWSEDYFAFVADPWNSGLARRIRADVWCVNLRRGRLIAYLLASGRWRPVFLGINAMVLERREMPAPVPSPPGARARLETIKSPQSAWFVFMNAVQLRDWQAAETALGRMEALYVCADNRDLPGLARAFLRANQAYYGHDYAACVRLLSRPGMTDRLPASGLLARALIFTSAAAWERGREEEALDRAREAARLAPTLHARYNLALMRAWLACQGRGSGKDGRVPSLDGLPPALARNLEPLARGQCGDRPPLALPHAP